MHLTTAIARPAARDESPARRAIAQPAPTGVNDYRAPVVRGGGNDNFVFNTSLGAGNVDRMTDFRADQDSFRLDDAAFTGLALGAINPSALDENLSGNADNASIRIIYRDRYRQAVLRQGRNRGRGQGPVRENRHKL